MNNLQASFFLLLTTFFVGNTVMAQAVKLDLLLKNVPLEQFIDEIEKKTDYTFIFDQTIDPKQRISVVVESADINVICLKAFNNINYQFEIVGKQIMLKNQKLPTPPKTVSGKVIDTSNEEIAGVSVLIKNSTIGTLTNANGEYILTIPFDITNPILVFSFIGLWRN